MNFDMDEMKDAMKDVRYQKTFEELKAKIEDNLSLDEALKVSLDVVIHAVNAEVGTFWFYDKFGDGRIHPKAVYGSKPLDGITLTLGEGIAGKVIETGDASMVRDCQKDSRWQGKVDQETGFKTLSMMCVPLRVKAVTFGCMQIINKTDGSYFDEKDTTFACNLSLFLAQLFKATGLLNNYEQGLIQDAQDSVSFMAVFGAADKKELHHKLLEVKEVSEMNNEDIREMIELAESMFAVVQRSREEKLREERKRKKGFFSKLFN